MLHCRYILPSLSLVPSDHEESVKVQYALVLAQLAAAANRFLLHLQHLANTQLQPDPSSPTLVSHNTPTYDMTVCTQRSWVTCALLGCSVQGRACDSVRSWHIELVTAGQVFALLLLLKVALILRQPRIWWLGFNQFRQLFGTDCGTLYSPRLQL